MSDRLLPLPLTERSIHLCIDMQRIFSADGPWPTPWIGGMAYVVERRPIDRARPSCRSPRRYRADVWARAAYASHIRFRSGCAGCDTIGTNSSDYFDCNQARISRQSVISLRTSSTSVVDAKRERRTFRWTASYKRSRVTVFPAIACSIDSFSLDNNTRGSRQGSGGDYGIDTALLVLPPYTGYLPGARHQTNACK